MTNQSVTSDSPDTKNTEMLKVNRSRKFNDEKRGRSNLQKAEIERICEHVRACSRYPVRDELLIRITYIHALRASEATSITWQQVDLKTRQLQVKRLKSGISNVHPITNKREILLLNKLYRSQGKPLSGFVFTTERKTAFSTNSFQKMFNKVSESVLGVTWNVHSLRHAAGSDLVSQGAHLHTIQHYLGHKNLQNTAVYLHSSPDQFKAIEL